MENFCSSSMKLFVSILVFGFVITAANAQWSTDPNVNNAICTATGAQLNFAITSDGSGGAIITWQDLRGGSTNAFSDIYAQRISAEGVVLWAEGGVAVCTATSVQATPLIISDGTGGAIIMWNDGRGGGGFQIYAQRINSAGVTLWTADGVLIKTSPGVQNNPAITSDGSGGAIITWDTFVTNFRYNIFAIKVNSEGAIQWSTTVCNDPLEQQFPQICGDGSGGAIIIWSDARPGINNNDLYAQHLNSSGAALWATDGIVFCAAPKHPGEAHLVSDNLGGAIIVWADYRRRDFYRDIYAQRIDVNGVVKWTTDGVAIYNTGSGDYISPRIISDGSGGAIIVFESAGSSIIGQRINSFGELQWGPGVGLGAGTWPQLTNSTSGGAIAAWHNVSNGKVFAQNLNANGITSWLAGGVIVSQQGGQRPQLVSDGNGGAIITWDDDRNTLDLTKDIFAQNVNSNGTLGNITTGVEENPINIRNIRLEQNYPNPFKQTTIIRYEITNSQMVTLKVYDLFGKEIKILVNEEQPAGIYEADFDGSKIASGTYVIELKAGLFRETKKMILLK
jgi:hypothetical protein